MRSPEQEIMYKRQLEGHDVESLVELCNKLTYENQRLLGEYDYYKNGYERRGELLERILALDPLFHDDLLDEMRKELSDG